MKSQIKMLRDEESVDNLIAKLEGRQGKEIKVLQKAVRGLGQIADTKAINYLISCLGKPDPVCDVLDIVEMMRGIGKKALPVYIDYLNTNILSPEKEDICIDLISSFIRVFGDRDSARQLILFLKNPEVSINIKRKIILALSDMTKFPGVVDALIWVVKLEDNSDTYPYYGTLSWVLDLIGRLENKRTVRFLRSILQTTDPYLIKLRGAAAKALDEINNPKPLTECCL